MALPAVGAAVARSAGIGCASALSAASAASKPALNNLNLFSMAVKRSDSARTGRTSGSVDDFHDFLALDRLAIFQRRPELD